MAQWINLNQNNSFVNRTQLPLLCENSNAILLVLLALMAGRPNTGGLKKFKFSTNCTARIFSAFKHCYHSVTNVFTSVFQVRCIARLVVEVQKMGRHVFSCRSLLLSTIVLNDKAEKPCLSIHHVSKY